MSHESRVKSQLRLDLADAEPGLRLFNNAVGNFWTGRLISIHNGVATIDGARRVQCGLMPGSGDLIGPYQRRITQLDIDRYGEILIAQFCSLEVKDKTRPTPAQIQWANFINEFGGVAGIVHNADEAIDLFKQPLKRA